MAWADSTYKIYIVTGLRFVRINVGLMHLNFLTLKLAHTLCRKTLIVYKPGFKVQGLNSVVLNLTVCFYKKWAMSVWGWEANAGSAEQGKYRCISTY